MSADGTDQLLHSAFPTGENPGEALRYEVEVRLCPWGYGEFHDRRLSADAIARGALVHPRGGAHARAEALAETCAEESSGPTRTADNDL